MSVKKLLARQKLLLAKKKEELKYRAEKRAILVEADKKDAKGLRRLILPEHSRPFIQKLSAAAGKMALKNIKNMS